MSTVVVWEVKKAPGGSEKKDRDWKAAKKTNKRFSISSYHSGRVGVLPLGKLGSHANLFLSAPTQAEGAGVFIHHHPSVIG